MRSHLRRRLGAGHPSDEIIASGEAGNRVPEEAVS